MISRRGFFGAIFGGAAAAVVAPFLPKLALRGSTTRDLPILTPDQIDKITTAQMSMFHARYIHPAMQKIADDADVHNMRMFWSPTIYGPGA